MRRDFTINRYRLMLETLLNQGFSFMRINANLGELREYSNVGTNKTVLLRQDIDRLPENSMAFARIQEDLGIESTFYFRTVPGSFNPEIIEKIAGMGHEIGYHYEDVSLTAKSSKFQVLSFKFRENDLIEESIERFTRNLESFKKIVPISSICMHGSPMSRWDSRLMWRYYDYREFGVECEPYFDINFEDMLYLTDTGRRWNGSKFSVRDKAEGLSNEDKRQKEEELDSQIHEVSQLNLEPETWNLDRFSDWKVKPIPGSLMNMTEKSTEFQAKFNFRTTNDIIEAAEINELSNKMMMTFHPQRWADQALPWVKELVWQNTKNVAKFFLIKIRQ